MEKMADKIEDEAKKEEDQYEKFECYCKKTIAELEENIRQAETNPISPADIDKKQSEISALQQEVKTLKDDRIAEEETLKSAEVQRGKEHDVFVKEVTEEGEVVKGVDAATAALKGGETASFLQQLDTVQRVSRAVDSNSHLSTDAKRRISAFLAHRSSESPGFVVGMLSGIKDDTQKEIKVETKAEDKAVENFHEVETAKKTEIATLLNTFERKMKSIGEKQVEVVNLKRELSDQGDSIEDDKKMLAELQKSCSQKAADWEERKSSRQKEQIALQDTIKMLDSDTSLDLFRKRSTALLQFSSHEKVKKALALVKAAQSKDIVAVTAHPELNFLALALSGKKADFTKILEKIDGLVELLKQESEDDKSKKSYCTKEFRSVEEKTKSLDSKIKTLTASVVEKKDAISKLSQDIDALQSGVKSLDSSVATAGKNRQAEHAEFQESTSSNSAALDLLSMARDRLNKVYNPSMVAPTTTKSPYDPYALIEIKGEKPPATFEGGYQQKTQESNGVLKMIDTLSSDIEKEMAVAKTEEADAQSDYEETIKDAAKKRDADLALVAQKSQDKADLETDLNDDTDEKKGKKKDLMAAGKFAANLHQECDWLLQNFDLRAEARTEEKENLIRAKTVLAGM